MKRRKPSVAKRDMGKRVKEPCIEMVKDRREKASQFVHCDVRKEN